MILLLSTGIMAFLVAIIMTPLIRKIALRYGVCAHPNHRTIHQDIVPKLGGVVIFAAYLAGFILIMLFAGQQFETLVREGIIFLIGGSLILIVGIYDDIKEISYYQKLIMQTIAAIIVILFGYKISIIINPFGGIISLSIFSVPFTLLWIVGITNAINLIDGLDGLAAGISLGATCVIVAISLWFGNIASAFPAAILAGALLAFLFFNFNPAKIFLGDSGSLFIGFMLACFSINGTFRNSSAVALLIPIIVLGIPITDTMLAFIRRLRKGVHPFVADREHVHHRLLNLGLSHRQVVLLMNSVSYFWGAIAFVIYTTNSQYSLLLLLIVFIMILIGLKKLGFVQYFVIGSQKR
jgi:UDP-GlcNAc:undecaprenyl-phosphate GlcNAc-1-phosphate transferase